jgi:hypothetical protein
MPDPLASLCSECGQRTPHVKPAPHYPALKELLEVWGSSSSALLCTACAEAVCRDLRGETVVILSGICTYCPELAVTVIPSGTGELHPACAAHAEKQR